MPITNEELEYLSIGSMILGSGGGGDPLNEVAITKCAFERYGAAQLSEIEALEDSDLVVPLCFMGAPLIAREKIPSGREFNQLLAAIEETRGQKPTALLPLEIGGANAFAPFATAAQLHLPILDGDTLGRAFPQLQMTSCNVLGISPSPAFLADSRGNITIIQGRDAFAVENIARHVTIAAGSSCAIALYLMSGEEAKRAVIPRTISYAIQLGRLLINARKRGEDPISALLEATEGISLAIGTITSIEQRVCNGFLEGNVQVATRKGGVIEILYQNEYLIAKKKEEIIGCTPDILMLLERESGIPITAESLRYGTKVAVVVLPSPAIWKTKKGLELVGPQAFGQKGLLCPTPSA